MSGGDPAGRPWRDSDVVLLTVLVLLGLIGIVAAWFGATHTRSLTSQMLWLNAAVAGFAVAAIGLGLWVMSGRRTLGERRASLVALDEAIPEPPATAVPRRVRSGTETAPLALVRITGARRAHDPSCPLVAGKEVEAAAISDADDRCGVCRP